MGSCFVLTLVMNIWRARFFIKPDLTINRCNVFLFLPITQSFELKSRNVSYLYELILLSHTGHLSLSLSLSLSLLKSTLSFIGNKMCNEVAILQPIMHGKFNTD